MLNKQGERALVYLSNVDELHDITFLNQEGNLEVCSSIERLVTKGWNLVVQKGRFEVDQLFVYAECDTILPVDIPIFAFLEGKRIRTKKLKGVVSQGVAFTIPEMLSIIEERLVYEALTQDGFSYCEWDEGDDWTELVGATKYDEELAKIMNGSKSLPPANAKGNFPSFIPKTDEERIQNLAKELKYDWQGKDVVITEKLDGSSITIYARYSNEVLTTNGVEPGVDFGICSRNLDLKLDSENSHFIKTGKLYMFRLAEYCYNNSRSLALQGEIIGPGLGRGSNGSKSNPYKLDKHEIYFFSVFDIDAGKRLVHSEAKEIIEKLDANTVPFVDKMSLNMNMEELLAYADGASYMNIRTNREGIVIRALDGSFSFKVISNKWLLKEKE